ncbi:MAG: putative tryptophan hydroxylase vioD [Solirubrobacterales bacterium]|nr:putative tryptophan hydroxylase vioD [Solirubrobacterales bacterium]
MAPLRVRVIGGGPAGLFAARLLATDHPGWDVRLYERLPPDDTFGFGVGLTGGLLSALRAADPVVHDAITGAAFPFSGAGFQLPHGSVRLGQFHAGAIARAKLLRLLLDLAVDAGVTAEIGVTCDVAQVRAEADLVIAADGVSSGTRDLLRSPLGVDESLGRGRFIWCGSETALDGTVFQPVKTEHGLYVAHAYPYAEGRSTFVIETDAESLTRAGCEQTTFADDSASDDRALDYLSDAFAELLEGGRFVGNKSRWMQFRTVRCERWSDGNVVLLGDAKATAHPSMGSGTKLALEDAIVLADVLRHIGDEHPVEHLAAFEAQRRPGVERIQVRAQRSQLWWESFGERLDLTPARVAVAYLSRAGAVSLEDLLATAPELVAQAVAEWAEVDPGEVPSRDLATWVLNRPIAQPGPWNGSRVMPPDPSFGASAITVCSGDPWGGEAEALVSQARALERSGAGVVSLGGGRTRENLLDRLAVGERLRKEVGVPVAVVSEPDQLDDVADGLVAGRADLVIVNPS